MKLSQAFSIAALAGSALAHPFSQIDKRQNIDLVVLQFALTVSATIPCGASRLTDPA